MSLPRSSNELQLEVLQLRELLRLSSNSREVLAKHELVLEQARSTEFRQALGLLSTLAPRMFVDSEHPLSMAQEIEHTVHEELDALRAKLREAKDERNELYAQSERYRLAMIRVERDYAADMTKFQRAEAVLAEERACHDCREYREMMAAKLRKAEAALIDSNHEEAVLIESLCALEDSREALHVEAERLKTLNSALTHDFNVILLENSRLTTLFDRRGETIAELRKTALDARAALLIPGVQRCVTCGFELHKLSMRASDGAIGVQTAATVPLEKCPNGHELLAEVTYAQAWRDMVRAAEAETSARAKAEAVLQGLLYAVTTDPTLLSKAVGEACVVLQDTTFCRACEHNVKAHFCTEPGCARGCHAHDGSDGPCDCTEKLRGCLCDDYSAHNICPACRAKVETPESGKENP